MLWTLSSSACPEDARLGMTLVIRVEFLVGFRITHARQVSPATSVLVNDVSSVKGMGSHEIMVIVRNTLSRMLLLATAWRIRVERYCSVAIRASAARHLERSAASAMARWFVRIPCGGGSCRALLWDSRCATQARSDTTWDGVQRPSRRGAKATRSDFVTNALTIAVRRLTPVNSYVSRPPGSPSARLARALATPTAGGSRGY